MASPAAARPRLVAGLRLVERVGEGGEGEVWEARDPAGRRRALKLIRPDALVPPAEVERRGRWLLAIDHPALVTVHRCGVLAGAGLDGWGFVEMAFVEGPSLVHAPADPHALHRLGGLAEGLDLLHAGFWSDGVPLIHRDVKPANLIEDPDGELVLVDASTLREIDDGTRTRIGTPLFAAPEVVTGRSGPLADVYGFAATAVALLTGARRGELARLLAEPDRLDLPPGLRAALADDPAQRPVSCRASLDPALPLVVGAEVGWQPLEAGGHAAEHDLEPLPRTEAAGDGADPGAWGPVDGGWLPPASEVLLDPWTDPYQRRPSPLPWGWVGLLAVLAGVPLAASLGPLALEVRLAALLGAAGAGILAAGAAGRPLLQALLATPVAWAFLVADRAVSWDPWRAWTRASCLGATAVLAAATAVAVLAPRAVAPPFATAVAAAAWATLGLAVLAGRGSRVLRLVLAPAWALGAVVLLLSSAVLLPLGVVLGRGRSPLALLASTVRGAMAFVRRA